MLCTERANSISEFFQVVGQPLPRAVFFHVVFVPPQLRQFVLDPACLAHVPHHILGMPIHDRVFQIKSLEIRRRCRFNFFRKPKMSAKLGDSSNIERNEKMLLICIEKRNIG